MRQGGLSARDELHVLVHAAQALVRAHLRRQANLASYPQGPRRRRGCARFRPLLRWPVTAAGDVHAKERKSSLKNCHIFRGVARNGDI